MGDLLRSVAFGHLHDDQLRTILVAVRPLTILRHHRAGLSLVRGRAPPLNLIRFCTLTHIAIVSTSENRTKPVQTSAKLFHAVDQRRAHFLVTIDRNTK